MPALVRLIPALALLGLVVLALGAQRGDSADEASDLDPLIDLLAQVNEPAVQLDLLKGMRDGLRGRKSVPMPKGWKDLYPRLAKSDSAEIREHSRVLALAFGDSAALDSLRQTLLDAKAPLDERRAALAVLAEKRPPDFAPQLQRLLTDASLRRGAIQALAGYGDDKTPGLLLGAVATLSAEERQDLVATLSSRPGYALALLDAVQKGELKRSEISAFTARQLAGLPDGRVAARLKEVWGELRETSQEKQALAAKYKAQLTPAAMKAADLKHGRALFQQTCGKCHRLFGEGAAIGPDLTGSNRANLDYVLENVLDPSAVVAKDYQLNVINTTDGRVLSGLVVEQNKSSLTVQTVEQRIVLPREDVERQVLSPISLMPEGQFDKLTAEEIRDLVAYLAASHPP